MTAPAARAEYTAGLRVLADWLDANPDLPLPVSGATKHQPLSFVLTVEDDQRAALAAMARALPGPITKTTIGADHYYALNARFAGLHVQAFADRDEVCERVVTGTHTVVKTVPAPDAPTVEVTEVVEDVEWRCGSILSERAS